MLARFLLIAALSEFLYFLLPGFAFASFEFLAAWCALFLLYAGSIRVASTRNSRGFFFLVFVLSALFRATASLHPPRLVAGPPAVFPIQWLISGVSPEAPLQSIVAIAFDLGSLALSRGLLKKAKLPLGLAAIHGFNPLVVAEVAGNGRVETLAFFFLLASVRLAAGGARLSSSIALGAALSGPLSIVATLPLFFKALGVRVVWALLLGSSAWVLLGQTISLTGLLDFPPPHYLGGSLLPALVSVSRLLLTRNALVPLVGGALVWLLLALIRASRLKEDLTDLPLACLLLYGAAVFMSPSVLPVSFILFACLGVYSRNRGWLVFTATAPVTYTQAGEWSFFLGFVQYFPAYASLVYRWLGDTDGNAKRKKRAPA